MVERERDLFSLQFQRLNSKIGWPIDLASGKDLMVDSITVAEVCPDPIMRPEAREWE